MQPAERRKGQGHGRCLQTGGRALPASLSGTSASTPRQQHRNDIANYRGKQADRWQVTGAIRGGRRPEAEPGVGLDIEQRAQRGRAIEPGEPAIEPVATPTPEESIQAIRLPTRGAAVVPASKRALPARLSVRTLARVKMR